MAENKMSKEEFDAYQECQMLPQAQYFTRRKREIAQEKIAAERNERALEHEKTITKISQRTMRIAIISLCVSAITLGFMVITYFFG